MFRATAGDEVRLCPGTYSPFTNNETLPIRVKAGVNLTSVAGAVGTTILGGQTQPWAAGPGHFPQAVGVFLPQSLIGLDAVHPAEVDPETGAPRVIAAQSLLSAENIRKLWVEMPATFTH